MVSLQSLSDVEPGRISFSSEFLDESNFISICPNPQAEREAERARIARSNADFEFLSGKEVLTNMMSADELFREGKILPFPQTHHADKLNKLNLKSKSNDREPEHVGKIEDSRINWFFDDDPSPRPPKCALLWKELLKLKKQRRPSALSSPSVSSSSSSPTRMSSAERERERSKEIREKSVKRIKKGTSIRIRPVLNVQPICTQVKNNVLPPLFSLRKGRLDQV